MILVLEKLLKISTAKVGFYSIKFKNQTLNEYQIFRNNDFSNHQLEFGILEKIIITMGMRGAKSHYFPKNEKGAFALPMVETSIQKANKKDFGIRLYCIHISESIVVLLNGGIKTKHDPAQCPNVSKSFDTAHKLERKIRKAIEEGLIKTEGVNITWEDNLIIDI